MNQKGTPLLFAFLALFALSQGPKMVSSGADKPPPTATGGKAESGTEAPEQGKESPADSDRWKEPVRLYREFFGIPADRPAPDSLTLTSQPTKGKEDLKLTLNRGESSTGSAHALSDIKLAASAAQYNLEFMVALVPDPLDSNVAELFDQSLEAIQIAFADSSYYLDRLWLPWSEDSSGKTDRLSLLPNNQDAGNRSRAYRKTPGLLLFRQAPNTLFGVFLVGETPKQGIHKEAFKEAMWLICGLESESQKQMRILGPSFSGSAESLRMAINQLRTSQGSPTGCAPDLDFRIVTGSATDPQVELRLGQRHGFTFERTVVPDDRLRDHAFQFLATRLGWDFHKAALLVEADTSYGREKSLFKRDLILVTFPSGLAELRKAWQKDGRLHSGGDKGAIPVPTSAADLDLADPNQPVDIAPEFSTLSNGSRELALANLLAVIKTHGIRYLGILATDDKDKLFLAKLVQSHAPDVVRFTFESDMLFAHPQYSQDMDGMLVLGSFPLFTESEIWQQVLPTRPPSHRYLRQFNSGFEEGISLAARKLISGEPVGPDARVWVSAVGNGSLWPITSILPASELSPPPVRNLPALQPLPILFFVLFLGMLGWRLRQLTIPAGLLTETGHPYRASHWLSIPAYFVLALLIGVTLLLFTLPLWAKLQASLFYLAILGLLSVMAFSVAAYSASSGARKGLALGLAGFLALPILACLVRELWMPGGWEYFQIRAGKLATGLTPILSFTCLCLALYSWFLLELKRRRLVMIHVIRWPFDKPCDDALYGCDKLSDRVSRLLESTLPPLKSRFWLFVLVVTFPVAIYLVPMVQPICEARAYGRFFIGLVLFVPLLCGISFYQFVRLWTSIARLLERLENSRLSRAFHRISAEVAWQPMKSFGWQAPKFKMVLLSAAKIARIRYRLDRCLVDPIEGSVKSLLEANRRNDLAAEITARRELQCELSLICRALWEVRSDPRVDEFLAMRVVAYLQPLLAHMRCSLMATMASGLFLLAGVRTYTFEPKRFVSIGIWAALLAVVAVTFWVFANMDRNAILSAIGDTSPGQITFNRHLLSNGLTYGLIPLLGVVVSQFPEIGRFLAGWFNPLLRVTGTG